MSDKNTQNIPRFKQQSIITMILKTVAVVVVIYLIIRFVKPEWLPAGLRFF